ncbi:MAG TPA: hypothetical protein PKD90_19780 [Phnomibacter sp.]|nr:hypothetical protein [Phnomibacter sp.]
MLTIYCPYHSPRLAYIAHWLGVQLTGQPAALVQHLKDAPAGQPLLAYCPQPPAVPALHIYPTGLLQQAGISPPTITWHQSPAGPAFFETPGQGTTLGFDVLAASFYLLSRYEEYLPHTKDSFGRYCHTQSTLWQQGLLHTPVVDGWVQFVKGTLQKLFPQWQPLEGQPQWQLTYDVDMVTAYKGKGLWRNTGGALMELVKGRWARLHQRMQVLRGNHPDPLLPYDHLLQWHER